MNPLPPSALMRPRVQPPAWALTPATRPTPASTPRVGLLYNYDKPIAEQEIKSILRNISVIQSALNAEGSHPIKTLIDELIGDCSESDTWHFKVIPVEMRTNFCRIRLFTCTPTPSMKDSSHEANVLTKNSSPEQVITVLKELKRQLHECLLPTSSTAEKDEKALLSKLPDFDSSLINAVCRFFNGGGDDKSREALSSFLKSFFFLDVEPIPIRIIGSNTTH